MIKVKVLKNKDEIREITIKGHALFDDYGKDIVCAAVSTLAITTINNIIVLDDSLRVQEDAGFIKISVLSKTNVNQKLLNNMVNMLKELEGQYPKNIEIRNED